MLRLHSLLASLGVGEGDRLRGLLGVVVVMAEGAALDITGVGVLLNPKSKPS